MSTPIDHANEQLPDVDDRLVAPECGYEIVDGKLVRVPPALPPHAIRHSKISALLEAYAADDFQVASDMLTRTSELNDFAPDASVYPRALDPATGGRQLEHLAFEVVSTESLSDSAKKARELSRRGVRRVFAIDVEHERALEWSCELETWSPLAPYASIDDPCFVIPLPIADLVSAAKADDAMARALLAKRNPVLVAAVAQGEARGEARGRAEGEAKGRSEGEAKGRIETLADALLRVLASRGLQIADDERARILGECDRSRLEAWLDRAFACTSVAKLLE